MLSNSESVDTKLQRIAEKARKEPVFKFTSLFHLMSMELLRGCFVALRKDAAAGIDQITKEEYGKDLDANLTSLVERLHRMSYIPQPVRRAYIPKRGSAESAYQKVSSTLKHEISRPIPGILYKTHSEFEQTNLDPGFIPEGVAGYAESAYQKISSDLKHDLAFKVPLVLFKTQAEFQQQNIIPGEVPEGVAAFAEPQRDRMVLPIDEPPDQLFRLITHELTHIFEFDIIPRSLIRQTVPLWVDEGLADYMAGVWRPLDLMTVRDAAVADIIPQMSKLKRTLGHLQILRCHWRNGFPGMDAASSGALPIRISLLQFLNEDFVRSFHFSPTTCNSNCRRTARITDPAPGTADLQPRRPRGVRCIRWIGHHTGHIPRISGLATASETEPQMNADEHR